MTSREVRTFGAVLLFVIFLLPANAHERRRSPAPAHPTACRAGRCP